MSKLTRRRLGDWAVALVAAAVAIVVTWGAVQTGRNAERINQQDEQIGALSQALTDEQSNAEAEGITPVAPPPDDLIEDPGEYTGPQGPSGPPGPGPTEAEIAAEVAGYFESHPLLGQPTAAELAAAVASYLADHPAEVPDDRLYEAMAAYFEANPPPAGQDGADGEDGADGVQGDPGPPPTRAEIQEAVEAYMAEHPLPMCPEGFAPEAHTVVTDSGPIDAVICVETQSTE
jgi:hypothetical protein